MRTRTLPAPTSRQMNEASRLATRFGKSNWTMERDGCMVLCCVGDNPEEDQQPLVVVLDPLGRPVTVVGNPRRTDPDD